MNTEEGNKLIKDFMNHTEFNSLEDKLRYHSSWDWLMPVVEKIEGNDIDLGISVVIKNNKCGIYRYKNSDYEVRISLCEADSKIKATHLAIIEFITWYNSLQPKT